MTTQEILSHIDHTQLKAFATWEDIEKLCREVMEFHTASVCVPPYYIERIHKNFPEITICTVVGFPLGYSCTEAKVAETKKAIEDGAEEIDMVINICAVKNGEYDYVEQDIRALREASKGKILKVIIETCYLTEEEKIRLCQIVTDAGADFIKTSTGFGTAGATLPDVQLFAANIGPDVKIKAAGGIRTRVDAESYLAAGCSRIGSSSAEAISKE
ncbi:MAG: deoxyribose-phosphate aldolase [Blautia sp.]|nr:deoxyribose-phosphate aldolase [Blautia sp.]